MPPPKKHTSWVDLRHKTLCDKCRRREKDQRRKSRLWGFLDYLLQEVRHRKTRRNHKVKITLQDLLQQWYKQNGKCALTGWTMTHEPSVKTATNVSIDRVDPALDYTADNISLVCSVVNYAKWRFTQDEFVDMCKAVANMAK
jgi:hypothetical protein